MGQDHSTAGARDLSAAQWKSGLAAWLGWMFDGMDMHLYPLVALPFVAELLRDGSDAGYYGSWIQASFLVGWALGGAFFGRVGDRLGRTRTLMLTILTYAMFTGLSFFAQAWWHLLIFRFLAALGIGGEWAVGASLLAETWPRRLQPWVAAVLQSGANCGVLLACLAYYLITLAEAPNRAVFLVGILPALIVFWIRRAVPESPQWQTARQERQPQPGILELFRGRIRRTTLLTVLVCATALTAHWAFLFWYLQHLRGLSSVQGWAEAEVNKLVSMVMILVMVSAIAGNFLAGLLATRLGYRRVILVMCLTYFGSLTLCYGVPRDYRSLLWCLPLAGISQGIFALFTMYLPPLFPTLLRTTGAGFCYNIGRIVAAGGTVFFGLFSKVGDYRLAILYAGVLFLPAALLTYFLPEGRGQGT
jgi:MFS family permease